MQTTLLGLAITFILALLAALIGPYFIDWSQFRPQFEREATRVIGMPVRVDGALDARLLPTPSLRLRDVAIGAPSETNNVSVEKLDIEFSLGDLMRGEWRANELTLNGLVLEFGLDQRGRVNWAARRGNFNLSGLTVDRLNVTGAIALSDAASRTALRLDDVTFAGEVRSLAGSVRGEGLFKLDGARYPFRLAVGRAADGLGQRLKFTVEPGAHAFVADLDGVMSFDDAKPQFDGALTLSKPPPKIAAPLKLADAPWRVTAKLKADPAAAKFDQVDALFGAEETGLKFTGSGDARFGASPRLRTTLSARQLDADRLLSQGGATAPTPAELLSGLRDMIAAAPPLPLAAEVDIAADLVNLGARPVQNLSLDLRANANEWRIDRFEFRAPGAARIALSGRITEPGPKATFAGALNLEAGDPEGFALWLQGQSDNAYRVQKPLKARSAVAISRERVTFDDLKAEIDGRPVAGRFALLETASGRTRLEAALKAERLDFSASTAFAKAMGGALNTWPDETALALDIAELNVFGQAFKPVLAQFTHDAKAITLERLRIGDADGVAIEGTGAFDRTDATGQMNLSATSATLDPLARLVAPVAPAFSRRIAAIPAGAGNVWVGVSLDLDRQPGDRVGLKTAVEINSPHIKGALTAALTPPESILRDFDAKALKKNEIAVTTKLTAERGGALLALLGLDGALAVGNGPAQFDASASGVWNAPMKMKAKLTGNGLDADIDGSAEAFKAEPAAAVALNIRRANLAPLIGIGITHAEKAPLPVALTSRVAVVGSKLTFDSLDGTVGGSRVRGKLGVVLGDEIGVDGNIGADQLDIPAALLVAVGAAGRDSADPLGRGVLRGWRGRVEFSALRATVPGGEFRPFNGTLRNDGQSLALERLSGGFGGGKIEADMSARTSSEGTSLTGRIRLSGVDGAAMRHRGLAMPTGRVAAQTSVSGQGRSAASLIGSLSGNGSVTIEQARIAGLDPRAFEAATRASDSGIARDDAKLAGVVGPALAAGALTVASAEIPFSIRDGQLRVSNTTLMGEGARLNLSGGYDIGADQIDVRAALAATRTDVANIGRPEILVLLFGSPDRPDRTVDVAALSSWLGLRAIDRETKRLESIERTNPLLNPVKPPEAAPGPPAAQPAPPRVETPAAVPPVTPAAPPVAAVPPAAVVAPSLPPLSPAAPPVAAAPPLPPPVEIRPVPGIARPPQRQSAPLVITPVPQRQAPSTTF